MEYPLCVRTTIEINVTLNFLSNFILPKYNLRISLIMAQTTTTPSIVYFHNKASSTTRPSTGFVVTRILVDLGQKSIPILASIITTHTTEEQHPHDWLLGGR